MLRAIEESDLEKMRGWRNSPTLHKYFRQWKYLTPYDQAKWYEDVVTGSDRIMFAIWNDGQMVGCCGLTRIDWKNRSAEISLYLGEPYVGGIPVYIDEKVAPLALKDLMSYAFDVMDLHRLWVEVFEYDDRKAKLLKDKGFTHEGTLKKSHFFNGSHHDSMFFGYLEETWRSASVLLN